jgi:cation diffusion facilitator family transporter
MTGLFLVTVAGALNFGFGKLMINQGKKSGSLQLHAGGFHLVSDGYTTAGLLAGITIVYFTGQNWLDNVLAIGLGGMISFSAIKIIQKATDGILDRSDVDLIEDIAQKLQSQRQPEWIDLHHVRIVKYGSFYHMDAHLTLPWYFTLEEAHNQVDAFEERLVAIADKRVEPAIHYEPCNPKSCAICKMTGCKERKADFVKEVVWSKNYILEDKHHSL